MHLKKHDNPDFEGAYTASGFGGQFITVIPKRKIVVAHKTKLDTFVTFGNYKRWSAILEILENVRYLKPVHN